MRRKGQHFLIDQRVIGRIASYAELGPSDVVLEIGPGTGNLTEVLSAKAAKVYAVEVDPALAADLEGRFSNVEVIHGDALKVDFPDHNKVVSNLPYQISSKITFKLLPRKFDLAVLMYQKEFAKKMSALPGSEEYGRLSIFVQHYAQAEIMERVPRSAFLPSPEIESAIVKLRPRPDRIEVDDQAFLNLVTGLFSHRRKKMRKALAASGVSKEIIAGLDKSFLEKRPEEITSEEAATLSRCICSF
jgi:16S rRNA (adenine1518-N6/adenine1519-N6)-dimethyltransferase